MKTRRFLLAAAFLAAAAGSALAELEAKDWSALQSAWNKAFKPDPSGDLAQSIAKGQFPEAVDDIGKSQGQDVQKKLEALLKSEIEPYLNSRIEFQLEVLEKLRAADDSRALKLLVTTVKLAANDLSGLRKAEIEAKTSLEDSMKKMTKGDKGMVTGSPDVIAAKNRAEARLAVVQPFVTHAIKIKRAALAGFGGAKGDKTVGWLLSEGIKDKDVEVRAGVAEALAEVDHADAAKTLEKALADRDAVVRLAALSSLIAKKAEGAKTAILGCLKDTAWEVRAMVLEAVQTLGFKDAETIGALIGVLDKEDGRLREDLDRVLYAITGK
ncbi:MAG: HEAT repeat domain-containing protein, partial [Planctomycetes bacterium]|nr:HEAT repeat domain-containing protein [Planctomycetota bacterium]